MSSKPELSTGNSLDSISRTRTTGMRSLPNLKLKYFARTPKKSPFRTVWLPVNASNRCNVDEIQDKLHIYYSRHFKGKDSDEHPGKVFSLDSDIGVPLSEKQTSSFAGESEKQPKRSATEAAMWMTSSNSIAPFASIGKPTCGYYFTRVTDNKKRLIGIPPTNIVQWRTSEVQR